MTTLTGSPIVIAQRMAIRSAVSLHLAVPAFDRRKILATCRRHGFTGRTIEQARVWVDAYCDELGIPRNAGLPACYVRHREIDTAHK